MKLLVPVTQVGEIHDSFDLDDTGDIPADQLEYRMNRFDEFALEAAVRLDEESGDCEVVAVTVGPERAEDVLRQALAKGADRAVRLWDDSLEAQRVVDPRAKAVVLAAFIEEEAPDLVLTGVRTEDMAFGATGVYAAHRLGYGWAAIVIDLEVDEADGVVRVQRELEEGLVRRTEVDLPAVLTIQTGINEPRYASLRGLRDARRQEMPVRSLADLGLDAADLADEVVLEGYEVPETTAETTYFEGAPAEAAAELVSTLRGEGVVT